MWLNWLEHRTVAPKVMGSSPIILAIFDFFYRGVAQLGSASALGAEGQRFESSRPDHFSAPRRPKSMQSNRLGCSLTFLGMVLDFSCR